jgi:hypothetical protein
MSKKTKRQYRRESLGAAAGLPISQSAPRPSDFNPDYTYVIHDLRRIGILAGSFLAILIILSFILPSLIR